jgi:hypothetical protein
MKIVVLVSFAIFVSSQALACLNAEKLTLQLQGTTTSAEDLEVRTLYLPQVCGLSDFEILTRTDLGNPDGTENFPAHSKALSSFIAQKVMKIPLPETLDKDRVNIENIASRLTEIRDQLEFRGHLLVAAHSCIDLGFLTEAGTQKASAELRHRLRRFFRENASYFDCQVLRD